MKHFNIDMQMLILLHKSYNIDLNSLRLCQFKDKKDIPCNLCLIPSLDYKAYLSLKYDNEMQMISIDKIIGYKDRDVIICISKGEKIYCKQSNNLKQSFEAAVKMINASEEQLRTL